MNTIRLKGVLRDIQDSHTINDIEFSKAHLVVPKDNGQEDILNIRFKKYSNPYGEDQEITLSGNVRSYSSKLDSGKNKVELYVFTYFDQPDLNENDQEYTNFLELDGRICKIDELRTTKTGKKNSYIPCIAWGHVAEQFANMPVNTQVTVTGSLHSRDYKKYFPDGSFEFRVAHEVEIETANIL